MAPLAPLILLSCFSVFAATQSLPTWPSPVNDELEDVMFLTTGYRARRFADPVTPCSKQSILGTGPGRIAAAEWLRTSFHDVANANQYPPNTNGGMDASIVYELGRSENPGTGFTASVTTWEPFFGPRAPMSEIIALGTYTSVRSCGGPVIPVRIGRVDATVAGDNGFVPQPQDPVGTFQNRFSRLNMNTQEMIQLVACGHTLGGVHGKNFPLIVPDPNGFQSMDSAPSSFDEKIAAEYVSGTTTNPLVIGPNTARRSDLKVNGADGNATITQMANPTTFKNTCQKALQKMIEVVPGGSSRLSANSLQPYEVKPYGLQLYLQDGGDTFTFAGEIRVRTTNRPASSISSVLLAYKDRSGNAMGDNIPTTYKDIAAGLDDSFAFYAFNVSIPTLSSISSFTVQVVSSAGTETFNNNGAGFPISDSLLLQYPQSCSADPSRITITAAVRNTTTSTPSVNFLGRRYNGVIIVPTLNTTSTSMQSASLNVGPYAIYNLTLPLNSTQSARGHFNITIPGTNTAVDLALLSTLPSTCTTLSPKSSTPPTQPAPYTYLGCVADTFPSTPRTLAGPFTYSNSMNTSTCAAYCSTYAYFGLEYSSECYCGSSLTSNSSATACDMQCSGAAGETCGGPGALSLYRNDQFTAPSHPAPSGWVYQGCYTDDVGNRTVQGYRTDNGALTIAKCAAVCDSRTEGYGVMGAEYHSECYCGTALTGTGTLVDDSQCDTVCSGDGKQSCGGAGRVSVYVKGNGTVTAASRVRRWSA